MSNQICPHFNYSNSLIYNPATKINNIPDFLRKKGLNHTSNKYLYISPDKGSLDIFFDKQELIIDEFGLQNCPMIKQNKVTLFGIDESGDISMEQNQILLNFQEYFKPDFLKYMETNSISLNSKKYRDNHSMSVSQSMNSKMKKKFPIFYIDYDSLSKKYYLKSLTNDIFFSYYLPPNLRIVLEYDTKNFFKFGKVITLFQLNRETKTISIKVRKGTTLSHDIYKEYKYSELPISIGRESCNFIIPCKSVSKTHVSICQDYIDEYKIFIVDNMSTNGSQLILQEGKNVILENEMKFFVGAKRFIIEQKSFNK